MIEQTTSPWKRRIGAGTIMALGVTSVAALLLLMNAGKDNDANQTRRTKALITVDPVKPKPLKRNKVRKKRPKRRSRARPHAPPPRIAMSLSGVAIDIPGLDAELLGGTADSLLGDVDELQNMVMTEEAVDSPPRLISRVPPSYPPRAVAGGITGKVTLTFVVDQEGQVHGIRVLQATPSDLFNSAAKAAVSRYRFSPGLYQGQRVKVRGRAVIRFELG